MTLSIKIIISFICVVWVLFAIDTSMKFRWIALNIELISSYVKEYILSVLAVKEKEYKEYRENLVQEFKEECTLFLLSSYNNYLGNLNELNIAYKEFEREKLENFDKALAKKFEEMNFEKYPAKVDEEYSKVVQTPLLKIYFRTIFTKVKSFEEFINKEYFDYLKEKIEENRGKVNG